MDKLIILLMVILAGVGITSITLFQDNGLIKDTKDTKENTHKIMTETHVYIDDLKNN